MSPLERDNLILEAALEWGADAMYDIQPWEQSVLLSISIARVEAQRFLLNLRKIPSSWPGIL